MKILAIDTSCDETAVAVTEGRRILSNELFSQIQMHTDYGGVMPQIARRAHEEHIDAVVEKALKKAHMTMDDIDAVAVTFGPGLAIALGVGIDKAKELAQKHNKKLIAVNHMEGHIYSCFAQNSKGNPSEEMQFPYIVLLVSGSHTELVLFSDHCTYVVIGSTVDDAAGEALDKAARLIVDDMVYPGGPLIEQLAEKGDHNTYDFPRPMQYSKDLHFSYSGLKTSLRYVVEKMSTKERIGAMHNLAASFQAAAFDALMIKLEKACKQYGVWNVAVGGGVSANMLLRKKVRDLVTKNGGNVYFPTGKKLFGDNAGMIGIAGHFHAEKGDFVEDFETLQRVARPRL